MSSSFFCEGLEQRALQDIDRDIVLPCCSVEADLDCTDLLKTLHPSSMSQRDRTLQETTTALSPAEALAAAKSFFSRQSGVYAAFPEQESARHITLRGQGGEEIVIAAFADPGGTKVTGSSYLFDQQVARFLATLAPLPMEVLDAGDA